MCRAERAFVGLVNARVVIMCICEACKCHVSALYYIILVGYQYGGVCMCVNVHVCVCVCVCAPMCGIDINEALMSFRVLWLLEQKFM